ncbi:MAG: PGPGW domain-containing protein [Ornithinibacter sp.]
MTPEEQRGQQDRHLLREADDEDDWEWRRRIRTSPRWRPLYQGAVFLVGLVMVLGGLALVPLPGPGWVIVILGIAVWASEFEPASRLLEFVKDKVRAWEQWVRAKPWWVKGLVGLLTLAFVGLALWLTMRLTGVPGLLPDGWEAWLHADAGL